MYKDLIKDKIIYSLSIPKTIIPSPSDDDYSNGVFDRYFTQKVNDSNGFVYEIDVNTYSELKVNPYWLVEILKWRLSGPLDGVYDTNGKLTDKGVIQSNKDSTAFGQKTIKNLNLYLINNLQFYK